MKILNDIIDVLSRENPNLENALTKTKVLLYRLGEESLAKWVNAELNGYSKNDDLPEYRVIPTRVLVTATDGYTARWTDYPAPLQHIKESLRKSLTETRMTQGIAALEHLVSSPSDTLARPLATEICPLLAKGLEAGIVVETAYCEIAKSQIISILAQIKSRLLDFILELSARLPDEMDDSDAKAKSKEIGTGTLFQNAIFGNNATILVGNHSAQSVTNTHIHNDFNALSELLRKHNLPEADISELNTAIKQDVDKVDHKLKQYGPNVKVWMKKMLGKAIDTVWQIDVGIASSLLAEALNSYYGWFK